MSKRDWIPLGIYVIGAIGLIAGGFDYMALIALGFAIGIEAQQLWAKEK